MIVLKRFSDSSQIEDFKNSIRINTFQTTSSMDSRIGLYSKIGKNIINIKDVTEEPDRGGPVFIHFYGIIFNFFKKHYLLGFIIPQILYTIISFGISVIKGEFLHIKILFLILWLYIYFSNLKRIVYIHSFLDSITNDGDNI